MKTNRLSGFIVLIVAILLVGGLTYYELNRSQPKETVASAPAVSSEAPAQPADQQASAGGPSAEQRAAADTGLAAPPDNPQPAQSGSAPAQSAANPPAPAAGNQMAPAPSADNQMAAAPAAGNQMAPASGADNQMAAAPAAEAPAGQASATPPGATPAPAQQMATAEPPPTAVAPAKPAAAAMAAQTPVVPSFDVVRVEPSGQTVVAGQAAPGSKVEVLDGAAAVATATANDRGEWAMALDNALKPGTHDLAIRTTSGDGAVSTLSDQRVAVQVPKAGSKDVVVVLNSPNEPSRVFELPKGEASAAPGATPATPGATPAAPAGPQVATAEPPPTAAAPASPSAPSEPTKPAAEATGEQQPGAAAPATAPAAAQPAATAEQAPAAAPGAEPAKPAKPAPPVPEVVVSAVEADTAGTLYVAGTATTDQPVRVYLNDEALGEAKPSPSGTWLVEVHHEVAPGSYQVRADQVSPADGTVVARAEVPFDRTIDVANLKASGDTGAAVTADVSGQLPAVQTVIIKKGDNLWSIARSTWGRGIRWSTLYQANKDQIRNPHWIYPGQVFIMPVSPDVAKN